MPATCPLQATQQASLTQHLRVAAWGRHQAVGRVGKAALPAAAAMLRGLGSIQGAAWVLKARAYDGCTVAR